MEESKRIVDFLKLQSHPEGGFYKEIYRSEITSNFVGFEGKRSVATSIYYLLEKGDFSALHRIKSDETWHFYIGETLEIVEISLDGEWKSTKLGIDFVNMEVPQYTVKAGSWFGSRSLGSFSLVGCSVYPGFDFLDFEMANAAKLKEQFPKLEDLIQVFTR